MGHRQDPIEGEIWKHTNGNLYKVLTLVNLPNEERYPTMVVYQTVANGARWARRLDDWHRSFTYAGIPYDGGS